MRGVTFSGKVPKRIVEFCPSELKNTAFFLSLEVPSQEFWEAISEPLLIPVLVFCFVQRPRIGINHSCFPETLSGAWGSFIVVSLGPWTKSVMCSV